MSAYEAALRALIVSLVTREAACYCYTHNPAMQIEARILGKQIDALRAELKAAPQ